MTSLGLSPERFFFLKRLNCLQWFVRLPIKWLIVIVTVFLVQFPYPSLLIQHINRWRNPNDLIEPNAPALEPWVAALTQKMEAAKSPQQALRLVEFYVYENLPYEWDWNNWIIADYLPTVEEALAKKSEDCDGRAVVAASLLARFGYSPEIVTDFAHVWVRTEHGELMGPGRNKALVATNKGLQLQRGAFGQLLGSVPFGVAVFPFRRELMILLAVWLMLLGTRTDWRQALVGLGLAIAGLVLIRIGGADHRTPTVWAQVAGAICLVAAILVLWLTNVIRSIRARTVSNMELPSMGDESIAL